MTYTVADMKKAGINRGLTDFNYKRAITAALRNMQIEEEFDTFCYIALAVTLSNGGLWDNDRVSEALNDYKVVHNSRVTTGKILTKAGILRTGKRDGKPCDELTMPFLKASGELIADHINNLPAQMLPLTDVPMWKDAHRNVLNIPAVSRVPKAILDRQPANVLNVMNKLQNVEFMVNPHLVAVLKDRLQEVRRINNEASIDKGRTEITVLKNQIAHLTELAKQQKAIRFLITADFRGRLYYRGGILTPQGHDFQKAAFQFAHSKKLGKNGKAALAIHYANVAGNDKLSTKAKLKWAMTTGSTLANKVYLGYIPECKEKYQALVAAMEWHRLLTHEEKGKDPAKFRSRLVCHMDGTCNGLQHGSALRKDRKTAEATNCTASSWEDKPKDVYQEGTDHLVAELSHSGHDKQALLISKMGRKAMKQAVMVTGYGAGKKRATASVLNEFTREQQEVLNQVNMESFVERALNQVAGSLIDTHKDLMSSVQDVMNEGVKPIGWKTADGFLVFQAARASDNEEKEFRGAGDFVYRVDEINPGKQATSITANFIHSMDAAHLRLVVQNFDHDIVTIHDSYGCHAGKYFELAKVVREQFVELHKYDQVLSFNKMNGTNVQLDDMGDYDPSEVMASEYFFS